MSWALAVVFIVALGLALLWIEGAFEALGGDGCLVRHALPHYVTFPPQGDLLQQYKTNVIQDGLGDCADGDFYLAGNCDRGSKS